MYEKNGIVYGDDIQESLKVVKAKPLADMMLLVTFNNNAVKLYDCSELIIQQAFKKLENVDVFTNITIVNGAVTWDNENIDIAPETMFVNGFDYNTKDILVA
ncbi:MAG: DUF2442 domain-containing protein [Oscillospiraceae bacterium]